MLPIKLPSPQKVTIKDKLADSEDILKYSTHPRLHCQIYNIPQSHEDIPSLEHLVGSTDQMYVKLDIYLKKKKKRKINAFSCHTEQTLYHAEIYFTERPNQKNLKTSTPVKHNTVT